MKDTIKKLGEEANEHDWKLYNKVIDMDNHMNDCDCSDVVWYDFNNIISHHEITTFCLNCGGIVHSEERV